MFFSVRGWGERGQSAPPDTSDREISADLRGKERQGKTETGEKKRRKREGEKLKMEGGKVEKWREDFFFLFFFFAFHFSKTTKICFESTRMGSFYREKAIYTGKKIRKMTLLPLKIFPLQRNKVTTHEEGPGEYVVHGPRTSSLRHCIHTVLLPTQRNSRSPISRAFQKETGCLLKKKGWLWCKHEVWMVVRFTGFISSITSHQLNSLAMFLVAAIICFDQMFLKMMRFVMWEDMLLVLVFWFCRVATFRFLSEIRLFEAHICALLFISTSFWPCLNL